MSFLEICHIDYWLALLVISFLISFKTTLYSLLIRFLFDIIMFSIESLKSVHVILSWWIISNSVICGRHHIGIAKLAFNRRSSLFSFARSRTARLILIHYFIRVFIWFFRLTRSAVILIVIIVTWLWVLRIILFFKRLSSLYHWGFLCLFGRGVFLNLLQFFLNHNLLHLFESTISRSKSFKLPFK